MQLLCGSSHAVESQMSCAHTIIYLSVLSAIIWIGPAVFFTLLLHYYLTRWFMIYLHHLLGYLSSFHPASGRCIFKHKLLSNSTVSSTAQVSNNYARCLLISAALSLRSGWAQANGAREWRDRIWIRKRFDWAAHFVVNRRGHL